MGLTKQSTDELVIALAGNPNTGKSTVFNALTGLNQHTGNWPGKTVSNAQGRFTYQNKKYILVDLPGTYSLVANSVEEEVARDFICLGNPDAIVIVTDATCLERNLNLALQVMEITSKVVVCVNLMDEACRKNITINLEKLSDLLGVPVIGTSARTKKGLDALKNAIQKVAREEIRPSPIKITYDKKVEDARKQFSDDTPLPEDLQDQVAKGLVQTAKSIAHQVVSSHSTNNNHLDRKLDNILTSKLFGIPIMIALLGLIFWLTMAGANIPSSLLAKGLFWIEGHLTTFFHWLHAPLWLHDLVVVGMYRTLAWVISVMLPPMAIFFPLFTLLEDLGYLPRVAFNLDYYFKKACTHGKQALTMCMGFGCNAAGVIGCRIIDSPRERLIAIITNNFVPCNGRFPMLIALASLFAIGTSPIVGSFSATLFVLGSILLGITLTLFISKLLSKTILKGLPSSFTLELPPYRKPQIGKIIVRSIFDRTLFVLGRAVAVAAPAGLVIWMMANVTFGNATLLTHCAQFLHPFAQLIGLDGYILMAFILGIPANEIVLPILIMSYLSRGSMLELSSLTQMRELLIANGWTPLTVICTMLFSLNHWPCATTLWTIQKETQSLKWTWLSFCIPTVTGIVLCFIITQGSRLIHELFHLLLVFF